eukprot:365661-Chlamydomonas_euryale.AAC.29
MAARFAPHAAGVTLSTAPQTLCTASRVVFNPVLNETFTATRGGGAFLNGASIQCSKTSDLGKALCCTEIGTTRDDETVSAIFERWES